MKTSLEELVEDLGAFKTSGNSYTWEHGCTTQSQLTTKHMLSCCGPRGLCKLNTHTATRSQVGKRLENLEIKGALQSQLHPACTLES